MEPADTNGVTAGGSPEGGGSNKKSAMREVGVEPMSYYII